MRFLANIISLIVQTMILQLSNRQFYYYQFNSYFEHCFFSKFEILPSKSSILWELCATDTFSHFCCLFIWFFASVAMNGVTALFTHFLQCFLYSFSPTDFNAFLAPMKCINWYLESTISCLLTLCQKAAKHFVPQTDSPIIQVCLS